MSEQIGTIEMSSGPLVVTLDGLDINIEISATGTRREDGRSAAQLMADMEREKEEANGS